MNIGFIVFIKIPRKDLKILIFHLNLRLGSNYYIGTFFQLSFNYIYAFLNYRE